MLSRHEASGEHVRSKHADPRLRRVTACHPTLRRVTACHRYYLGTVSGRPLSFGPSLNNKGTARRAQDCGSG